MNWLTAMTQRIGVHVMQQDKQGIDKCDYLTDYNTNYSKRCIVGIAYAYKSGGKVETAYLGGLL